MKLIFFHSNLHIGGIEKSLVNLLNGIVNDYDVELVLLNKTGKLLNELDKKIKVSSADGKLLVFGVSKNESKSKLTMYIKRNYYALKRKCAKTEKWIKKLVGKTSINYNCDIAISYSDDAFLNELVLQKVNANKKFVFYHSDFRNKRFKNDDYINRVSRFDKYICVSKSCRDIAVKCCPKLAGIADYLYNSVNIKDDFKPFKYQDDLFNIITVARISEEKRIDWGVEIVAKLVQEGYKIKYYICGNGKKFELIKKIVASLKLENNVIFLGEQINPYRYIKNADLFMLLSRTESFGICLVESMLLGVPCLTTNTISANEIVGEYGFVCEHDKDEIYLKIKEIIENKNIIKEKKKLLKSYDFNNQNNIRRFKSFCGEEN